MAYDDFEDKSFKVDENYFKVVIPDLDPGKTVPIQLRWQYADKSYSGWSASYTLDVPLRDRPKPTDIVATWVGTDLKITWNASELATGFVVFLTGDSGIGVGPQTGEFFKNAVTSQTGYEIVISEREIRDVFNDVFVTTFTSSTIIANYLDYQTDPQSFTVPAFTDGLTGSAISDASWSITSVDDGSIVAWDKISSNLYYETEVWRSDTQNGTYIGAGGGTNTPVKVSHISDIWIKIRHKTKRGTYTQYSNPKQASRYDPIFQDVTPPNSVTVTDTNWNGYDLVISYTMPATEPGDIIKVKLQNGIKSGLFYGYFPSDTGSHTFTILDSEIFQQFDDRFSSYTGTFYSIDYAGNEDTGTGFTTKVITNPGDGVTPTFTLTGITNGYTATWNAPSWVTSTKVYEGTTAGFTPNDSTNLVYSGSSPAIIKTLGRPNPYARKYIVIRYFGKISGHQSNLSAEQFVDPIDALTADISAPDAPSTGGSFAASAGIDTNGTMGFNGYINLAWNAVSDSTLRGYRIRFRPYKASAPFENYSYVDSPGTGTTYRLAGLAVGAVYEIAVATYDEYNNTSSYTSYSNQTVSGVPAISNYITAGAAGFQFGSGIKDKTGSQNASAQGIYLSNSNYWYLTASNAAQFKIGGSTSNYVEWDGALLKVDGDLGVAGGTTIGGNISMKNSGASIYAGTLNQSGALSSDGFMLNYGGLAARKTFTVNGQTVIKEVRLQTGDGIYADYGQIAGWIIKTGSIENLVDGLTGQTKYTGMSSDVNAAYAFWAGSTGSGGNSSAKFLVTPAGAVTARNISIISTGTGTSKMIDAGPFFVQNNGYMEATSAKITGEINASSGKISGPLTIGSANEPGGYLQVLAGSGATTGFLEIGYGLTKSGNPYFGIQAGTQVTATNVRTNKFEVSALTGEMTAVGGGNIGGWTIGTTQLNAGTGSSYVGLATSGTHAIWAGSATASSAPFRVTAGGALTASNAEITGNLKATSGYFGGDTTGWIVTSTGIRSALNTDDTLGVIAGKTAKVSLNGTTGTISGATLSGGVVVGTGFYIGSDTNATDKILSTGVFSLAGGLIRYNGSLLEINPNKLGNTTFKIKLNVTSNEDGTFGDSTLVQAEDGEMTIGRAFFYGGLTDPRTGGPLGTAVTARSQVAGGAQGINAFNKGDIWLQRVS
jgi:hypothetical protein